MLSKTRRHAPLQRAAFRCAGPTTNANAQRYRCWLRIEPPFTTARSSCALADPLYVYWLESVSPLLSGDNRSLRQILCDCNDSYSKSQYVLVLADIAGGASRLLWRLVLRARPAAHRCTPRGRTAVTNSIRSDCGPRALPPYGRHPIRTGALHRACRTPASSFPGK